MVFNAVLLIRVLTKFHDVTLNSWFHGKIPRKDAENLLSSPGNPPGAFLIRESESASGALFSH